MTKIFALAAMLAALALPAQAQENYENWPLLKSTFPSTGGGGVTIKGYDPVIVKGKCVTTFMASIGAEEVYFHVGEYDAVPAQGGLLCTNGTWKSFDGATGTTPFRMFFKGGVFRAAPG